MLLKSIITLYSLCTAGIMLLGICVFFTPWMNRTEEEWETRKNDHSCALCVSFLSLFSSKTNRNYYEDIWY